MQNCDVTAKREDSGMSTKMNKQKLTWNYQNYITLPQSITGSDNNLESLEEEGRNYDQNNC